MLTKSMYAYTTGAAGTLLAFYVCTHEDSNWKNKLTAVNSVGISYDAIGNPLNDGHWIYTWQKGRQLQSMSKSGETVSFLYNEDGLRVQKVVASTARLSIPCTTRILCICRTVATVCTSFTTRGTSRLWRCATALPRHISITCRVM